MKVFLVNENVDLGYHVLSVYLNVDTAESEAKFLNNDRRAVWIKQYGNDKYYNGDKYWVEEMAVTE